MTGFPPNVGALNSTRQRGCLFSCVLEPHGNLDAAEVLLVRLIVARGVQIAGVAEGLEPMLVQAGDRLTYTARKIE